MAHRESATAAKPHLSTGEVARLEYDYTVSRRSHRDFGGRLFQVDLRPGVVYGFKS